MKKTVIYVHGYGSNGQTETARNLRRILESDYDLVAPSYRGSNPEEAVRILEAACTKHDSEDLVIAGTSLGGFFANYLARKFNKRSVIVNPSANPSTSLGKYGESADTLSVYSRLEAEVDNSANKPARVVVIGVKDDVVDPHSNGMLMKDNTQMVMLQMGHRIEPQFYETVAGLIRTIGSEPL